MELLQIIIGAVLSVLGIVFVPIMGHFTLKQKAGVTAQVAQTKATMELVAAINASTITSNEVVRTVGDGNLAIHTMCTQMGVLWDDRKAGFDKISSLTDTVNGVLITQNTENGQIENNTTAIAETNRLLGLLIAK